jgi:hypothetical protein
MSWRASPTASPRAAPMQRPGGGRGFGGAFGKVTVVSATSFVVEDRQGGNAADGTTAPITVMTTAATSSTVTEAATAAALSVGQCVSAMGPVDSTGAVTARSIGIRPRGPKGCATGRGFGGRGSRGNGGNA